MYKTPKIQHTATLPNAYPGKTFTCVTCEAEIRGRPTFWVGLAFCCAGCAVGGPCTCSYDTDVKLDFDFDYEYDYELPPAPREPVLAGG